MKNLNNLILKGFELDFENINDDVLNHIKKLKILNCEIKNLNEENLKGIESLELNSIKIGNKINLKDTKLTKLTFDDYDYFENFGEILKNNQNLKSLNNSKLLYN